MKIKATTACWLKEFLEELKDDVDFSIEELVMLQEVLTELETYERRNNK